MKQKSSLRFGAVLLLAGFWALLLLPYPLWYLLRGKLDTENHENRTLAEFPSLAQIEQFPARFEAWLEDRAPFRNQLMTLNTGANLLLGTLESGDVLRGKEGWLFLKDVSDSQSISDYQGLTSCTPEESALLAQSLNALAAELEARGSRLVVLFAPAKEMVYADYMPDEIPVVHRPTRVQGLTQYLTENTTIPVVYPLEPLLEAHTQQQVYYRYDTHWNEAGAWIAAQEVLRAMGRDAEEMPEFYVDDTRQAPHDLADMSAAWAFCTDDVVYTADAEAAQLTKEISAEVQYYKGSGETTLLLVRDSFGTNLAPWLCRNFETGAVLHNNAVQTENLQMCQQELGELPDVVVFECGERFYNVLQSRVDRVLEWVETLPE